jgi:hypothetical protein
VYYGHSVDCFECNGSNWEFVGITDEYLQRNRGFGIKCDLFQQPVYAASLTPAAADDPSNRSPHFDYLEDGTAVSRTKGGLKKGLEDVGLREQHGARPDYAAIRKTYAGGTWRTRVNDDSPPT